jgi:hypothetical protein
MEYHVVSVKGKGRYSDDFELIKTYGDREEADKKIQKMLKKDAKLNLKVVAVPDVRAGLKLYKRGGLYYMTIVQESKNIYFLNSTQNEMELDDCILKTNIYKYFYMGIFDDNLEQFDSDYEKNVWIDDTTEDEVKNYEEEENSESEENAIDEG